MYNLRLTHREISAEKIPAAGRALREFVVAKSIKDHVILQTCNRAELYYLGAAPIQPDGFLFGGGAEAFRHLLRVACGLDSMVVGETEILSQVKNALAQAEEERHCSKELSRYFMDAIRIGRKVRKLTKISAGRVSVVSIALEHVRSLLGDLTGKKFLVVGAGEMGTKVARSLKNMEAEKILISNRNYPRALSLAREIGGSAHPLTRFDEIVKDVDCIFCATSAPHPILTKDRLRGVKEGLILVDLSVPRNVEESVRELDAVKLVSMEHFHEKATNNMSERAREAEKVEEMIEQELGGKDDNLQDLYLHAKRVRSEEVRKAKHLLNAETPQDVIDGVSKTPVKKLYYPLKDNKARVSVSPESEEKV